jgi:hypothetical protein
MPVDWIAEHLLQAVALAVLKLDRWSVRQDGFSFEIPQGCFHQDFTKGYNALVNDFRNIYPRLRIRCEEVYSGTVDGNTNVRQSIICMNGTKHRVYATFRADGIDFQVVQSTKLEDTANQTSEGIRRPADGSPKPSM